MSLQLYRCKENLCSCKIRIINNKIENIFCIYQSGEHSHDLYSRPSRGLDLDMRKKLMPLVAGKIYEVSRNYICS